MINGPITPPASTAVKIIEPVLASFPIRLEPKTKKLWKVLPIKNPATGYVIVGEMPLPAILVRVDCLRGRAPALDMSGSFFWISVMVSTVTSDANLSMD